MISMMNMKKRITKASFINGTGIVILSPVYIAGHLPQFGTIWTGVSVTALRLWNVLSGFLRFTEFSNFIQNTSF